MKEKINTVKIGDEFENKSYDIIEKLLNEYKLSLIPGHCTIYRKKKYQAEGRSNGIIFDLSIEVKPPNANNVTMLYLIECKNYSSSIPVDEVSLFAQYISQIKNFAVKGVFITNNRLQQGALEQIKHNGIMLIEVDEENYNITHYKNEESNAIIDFDSIILNTLCKILLPQKIQGLKRLSKKQINNIAFEVINEFNPKVIQYVQPTPLFDLLDFLKKKYDLKFHYADNDANLLNNKFLGYFNSETNTIIINPSIRGTKKEPFVIGHEIGHFILHRELKVNKTVYNNFKDTEFNLFKQSYSLDNPKNWIEWQANAFSSALLLPDISIEAMLIAIQQEIGISKAGRIYLDEQECNRKDFQEIIERLSIHFQVSKINVEYRLESLNLIYRAPRRMQEEDIDSKEFLRQLSIMRAKSEDY